MVGVIWHCGRGGAAAGSDIDGDTEPVLGKVTIGLMGKGAVMSSHGGKNASVSLSATLSQM